MNQYYYLFSILLDISSAQRSQKTFIWTFTQLGNLVRPLHYDPLPFQPNAIR